MKKAIKSKDQPLTSELILEFHRIAVEGVAENNTVAGHFRNSDDIKVIENNSGNTLWTPPKSIKIEQYIELLVLFAGQ